LEDRAAKWEKEIRALEARQSKAAAEKGGVVFAGSSTVRGWDLARSFPGWMAINSGFGGSEIRDATRFADRMILNHEPRTIILYAGDNDINSGRTPEQVLADFQAFAKSVHKKLPATTIYFISIKPSLARWKQYPVQSRANALVRDWCVTDRRLGYIDAVPAMLGSDGQPRAELFVKDGLHLSAKGYEALSESVRKAVK
jgi:lysophospholipase L1-like esterase